MSNTIGRAKILTAPCIFFKKGMPRRSGRIFGEDFGEDFRGREAGKQAGTGGTGQAEPQVGEGGTGGTERAVREEPAKRRRGDRSWPSVDAGAETGRRRKRGRREKPGKLENAGKCWKMLEKTGKSDRGLPGRRSGGTGRERHSAVKPRRYRSLKPSSSTSTGQYSRSSSRRKRTV